MFYALVLVLCFKMSLFAQNQPFIVTEVSGLHYFDLSPEYLEEIRAFYETASSYYRKNFNYWGMTPTQGGYQFKTIASLNGLIFPDRITSFSDLEDISRDLSFVFGFYEVREENKLPRYVTPTVDYFNNIAQRINEDQQNLLIPLKFYRTPAKRYLFNYTYPFLYQDSFQYLYRFAHDGALPVVDPHSSIAMYLRDTAFMKAGIVVTPPLMVKVYQKLVNHFLFFLQYLLKNKHLHKDYMTLYDLVIMEIGAVVDFDLGNVFTQYQTHLKSDYHLGSTWGLPNVKMSLSFKEMLSNMISDLVAPQDQVSLKKSITIDIQNLINKFFESVPEMNPNVTFLPRNAEGEFMRYQDFLDLSKEQFKFLIENVKIEK